VNAAHPPLLVVSDGASREIYRDGPFLGLSDEIDVSLLEQDLAPGDAVLAYTDGLSDQLAGSRGSFRVEDAVREALRGSPPLPAALEDIISRFDQFRGATAVADDITLIGVRLRK
jgi:serine phosphatase RsbU (regulator of sigma subunit)